MPHPTGRRKIAQENRKAAQTDTPDSSTPASDSTTPAADGTTPPPPGEESTELQTRGSTAAAAAAPEYNGWILLETPRRCALFQAVARHTYENYLFGGPRLADLRVLIRINVMNAMVRNAVAMGFPATGLCADDYISPYSEHGPRPAHQPLPLSTCPKDLRPTAVQKRFAHHPWIDLIPFPRFRDNMILAVEADMLDEDELCLDVAVLETAIVGDNPALIVWGDSWDYRGWEVSPAFFRKWGWLLQGCPEVLEGTNYWRAKRGEKRLVFNLQ